MTCIVKVQHATVKRTSSGDQIKKQRILIFSTTPILYKRDYGIEALVPILFSPFVFIHGL